MARKSAGAASAEEGLECVNLPGNRHKVVDFKCFTLATTILTLDTQMIKASHCKLCLGSITWHHGWPCSRLHELPEQGFHRGDR